MRQVYVDRTYVNNKNYVYLAKIGTNLLKHPTREKSFQTIKTHENNII